MNKYLSPKINELFDILENDMESRNYAHAEIILARLSKYFHLFDDELTDYYQYAQDVIAIELTPEDQFLDDDWEEDYYEPSELTEWLDFDPDC